MSCISYFGGKSSKVFKELINTKIPKTGISTYIEPFSGSMASYMDDDSLIFDTVIYNDRNRHQTNLMYCCSFPDIFLKHIESMKKGLLNTDEKDPIKKWEFYKSIYKEFQKNSFLDDVDFEIGNFEKASIYSLHKSCASSIIIKQFVLIIGVLRA
jgi:site-specific DNA-adenine methylase